LRDMTSIQNILLDNGPMISSDLARKLAKSEGITINAASQRISRDQTLERIEGFFKSNQSLIFLPDQAKDGAILSLLAKQMEMHGKKYWYVLNALRYHSGSLDRSFLETYANHPINPVASHFTFEEVLQKFVQEKILVFNGDEYSFSPRLRYKGLNLFLSKTLNIIKLYVLDNFKNQAKNIGLVSYDSAELFGEHGNFRWAFKGISPLNGLKQGKDFGFVIADVLLGRPTRKKDLDFFIKKLEIIKTYKNASRVMPILLVDNLDHEGFMYLKEKGIVVGLIGELFGQDYAKTLNDLITVLTNAAASLANDPNKYLNLITELRKYNEGLLKNMKGTLFEYVAGHYYLFKGASIDLGWEIIEDKAIHEMDIRASFGNKIIIAECKARVAKTQVADVNNWVRVKAPAFKRWIKEQDAQRNKEIEFEYWSTSGFDEDALKRIEELKVGNAKNVFRFIGPNEILHRALEMKNPKLRKALNTFFLKSNL